jgi:hypothetical protein
MLMGYELYSVKNVHGEMSWIQWKMFMMKWVGFIEKCSWWNELNSLKNVHSEISWIQWKIFMVKWVGFIVWDVFSENTRGAMKCVLSNNYVHGDMSCIKWTIFLCLY